MTKKQRLQRWTARLAILASIGILLFFWQRVNKNTAVGVSRPSDIWGAFEQWWVNPALRHNIPVTLEEAAIGYVLCVTIAIVLAGALASSRLLSVLLQPFLTAFNSVPKLALAPLFIILAGTGIKGKVYFIAVAIFFVPFYSALRALTTVDPVIINHARMLGAPRRALIVEVYLPSVLGSLTAVLRITAQFCLAAAVISEFIAASAGIGWEVNAAYSNTDTAVVISGVLIVAIIGFAVDRVLVAVERHFSTWRITT